MDAFKLILLKIPASLLLQLFLLAWWIIVVQGTSCSIQSYSPKSARSLASLYYREFTYPVNDINTIDRFTPYTELAKDVQCRLLIEFDFAHKSNSELVAELLVVFDSVLIRRDTASIDLDNIKSVSHQSVLAIKITVSDIKTDLTRFIWEAAVCNYYLSEKVYGISISCSPNHPTCSLDFYLNPNFGTNESKELVHNYMSACFQHYNMHPFLTSKDYTVNILFFPFQVAQKNMESPNHWIALAKSTFVTSKAYMDWEFKAVFDHLLVTNNEKFDAAISDLDTVISSELARLKGHSDPTHSLFRLVPAGSVRLGGHLSNSDYDIVCILATSVSFSEFATIISNRFKHDSKYFDFVPILSFDQLKFKYWHTSDQFVDIDLLLVHYDAVSLPKFQSCFEHPFQLTKVVGEPRGITAIMNTEILLSMIPNGQMGLFQKSLRLIKFWAERRAIYHGSMGYLNGIVLATQLIFVMRKNPTLISLRTLVMEFFQTFADWDWNNHIDLACIVTDTILSTITSPMKVFTVAPEPYCITYAVSKTTLSIISKEFQRAAEIFRNFGHFTNFSAYQLYQLLMQLSDRFKNYKHWLQIIIAEPSKEHHLRHINMMKPILRKLLAHVERKGKLYVIPYSQEFSVSVKSNSREALHHNILQAHSNNSSREILTFADIHKIASSKVASSHDLVKQSQLPKLETNTFSLYLGLQPVVDQGFDQFTLLEDVAEFFNGINQKFTYPPIYRVLSQEALPNYVHNAGVPLSPHMPIIYNDLDSYTKLFHIFPESPLLNTNSNISCNLESVVKFSNVQSLSRYKRTCTITIVKCHEPFCSAFKREIMKQLTVSNTLYTSCSEILITPLHDQYYKIYWWTKLTNDLVDEGKVVRTFFSSIGAKLLPAVEIEPKILTYEFDTDLSFNCSSSSYPTNLSNRQVQNICTTPSFTNSPAETIVAVPPETTNCTKTDKRAIVDRPKPMNSIRSAAPTKTSGTSIAKLKKPLPLKKTSLVAQKGVYTKKKEEANTNTTQSDSHLVKSKKGNNSDHATRAKCNTSNSAKVASGFGKLRKRCLNNFSNYPNTPIKTNTLQAGPACNNLPSKPIAIDEGLTSKEAASNTMSSLKSDTTSPTKDKLKRECINDRLDGSGTNSPKMENTHSKFTLEFGVDSNTAAGHTIDVSVNLPSIIPNTLTARSIADAENQGNQMMGNLCNAFSTINLNKRANTQEPNTSNSHSTKRQLSNSDQQTNCKPAVSNQTSNDESNLEMDELGQIPISDFELPKKPVSPNSSSSQSHSSNLRDRLSTTSYGPRRINSHKKRNLSKDHPVNPSDLSQGSSSFAYTELSKFERQVVASVLKLNIRLFIIFMCIIWGILFLDGVSTIQNLPPPRHRHI